MKVKYIEKDDNFKMEYEFDNATETDIMQLLIDKKVEKITIWKNK